MDGLKTPAGGPRELADARCARLIAPTSAAKDSDACLSRTSLSPYRGAAIDRSCRPLASPSDKTHSVEVAGPQRFRFDAFIREGHRALAMVRATWSSTRMRDISARKLGELTLVASDEASLGEIRFEDWLNPAMSSR